jgi:protein-tyrosine phosphatase
MWASDGHLPQAPAGIPNFAWVEEGRLARGMQPALTLAAYHELRAHGFTTVLSLRQAQEYLDEDRRRYRVTEERALCRAVGLRLVHVPLGDYQAPRPSEMVRALTAIHRELATGGTLYVHCFAGVGRTGVVCGAWQMLRGMSGDEALRQFEHFCLDSWRRALVRRPELRVADYLENVGAHGQAWVLQRIAAVVGRPVTDLPSWVRPRRPAHGAGWERRFRQQLVRRLGVALDTDVRPERHVAVLVEQRGPAYLSLEPCEEGAS